MGVIMYMFVTIFVAFVLLIATAMLCERFYVKYNVDPDLMIFVGLFALVSQAIVFSPFCYLIHYIVFDVAGMK